MLGTRLRIKRLQMSDAKTDRHIPIMTVLHFLFKKLPLVTTI